MQAIFLEMSHVILLEGGGDWLKTRGFYSGSMNTVRRNLPKQSIERKKTATV